MIESIFHFLTCSPTILATKSVSHHTCGLSCNSLPSASVLTLYCIYPHIVRVPGELFGMEWGTCDLRRHICPCGLCRGYYMPPSIPSSSSLPIHNYSLPSISLLIIHSQTQQGWGNIPADKTSKFPFPYPLLKVLKILGEKNNATINSRSTHKQAQRGDTFVIGVGDNDEHFLCIAQRTGEECCGR